MRQIKSSRMRRGMLIIIVMISDGIGVDKWNYWRYGQVFHWLIISVLTKLHLSIQNFISFYYWDYEKLWCIRKIDIIRKFLCFENSKVLIANMKDRWYNYFWEKKTIWRDKSEERTCQKIRWKYLISPYGNYWLIGIWRKQN